MAEDKKVGKVLKYFSKISVAAIEVSDMPITIGDNLHFKGHTTDFQQKIESMQVENASVTEAKVGDCIGIKVNEKVRDGDIVYKVEE